MIKNIFIFVLLSSISIVGSSCRCADEAVDVAHDEFGPRAMLTKYEWFKDAAASLDAKNADIKVFQKKLDNLSEAYPDIPRGKWARDDREQWNITSSEIAGMKASFNSLASEYNASMAKFNWRFAEAGSLPPGATVPLPRSYKPYLEN